MKDFIAFTIAAVIITTVVLGVFCVGGGMGLDAGRRITQQEAIEAGAARWTIEPTTGVKTLEWITK